MQRLDVWGSNGEQADMVPTALQFTSQSGSPGATSFSGNRDAGSRLGSGASGGCSGYSIRAVACLAFWFDISHWLHVVEQEQRSRETAEATGA